MYIDQIADLYEEQGLHFELNESKQNIHMVMNTRVVHEVLFHVRIVNEKTVLFTTRLPMKIPENCRDEVAKYLTRANYGIWVGAFQLDLRDGELLYVTSGCHDEDEVLSDEVIMRLTYLGFQMFDRYLGGMFAVLYGGLSAEQAYAQAEEEMHRAQGDDE